VLHEGVVGRDHAPVVPETRPAARLADTGRVPRAVLPYRVYRTRHADRAPKVGLLLRVDAERRPIAPGWLILSLGLAAAGLAARHFGLLSPAWVVASFFLPTLVAASKALVPALVSHWLEVGPREIRLWGRLGPFASQPLGALPFEAGLGVRATPLGGRLPLEIELSVEGPSGRLTWRTLGLGASAAVQDEVIRALDARLAAGRPGSFHGGRVQVRRDEGRLELAWPGDAPTAARTRRRLSLSAAALAVAAAGPSLAPAAHPGGFAILAAAALGVGLVALLRAPTPLALARSTLVLTPRAWCYEKRSLFWRASRSGGGFLRAGPGRTGPGPRRDVEGAEGRVTLAPRGKRAFDVGRSLTLRERRWLVELVERFYQSCGTRA
jgi:hypothetical protein